MAVMESCRIIEEIELRSKKKKGLPFKQLLVLLYKKNPAFSTKLVYSYVIEVADSEYQLLLLHHKPLVSEIFIFPRIRVT